MELQIKLPDELPETKPEGAKIPIGSLKRGVHWVLKADFGLIFVSLDGDMLKIETETEKNSGN